MKNLLFVLLFIPLLSIGQNISKLEELNGFRELKLGSDIREYSFVEKANSQNTSYYYSYYDMFKSVKFQGRTNNYPDSQLFVIKKGTPNYQVMPAGDKIEKVFIDTFENKIFEIKIVVHHRTSSDVNLLSSMREAFGNPNIINSLDRNFNEDALNSERYTDYWSGKNISLHIIAINGSKIWLGTKRRFYWVIYSEMGEIFRTLNDRKKRRDSIKKQKLIDDF